jgi:hypothetical protein
VSEMFATTGRSSVEPCGKCGADVERHEFAGVYTGKIIQSTERHRAPCGLFCFGAGVPPREYRLRQIHGHDDYECPSCAEKERP